MQQLLSALAKEKFGWWALLYVLLDLPTQAIIAIGKRGWCTISMHICQKLQKKYWIKSSGEWRRWRATKLCWQLTLCTAISTFFILRNYQQDKVEWLRPEGPYNNKRIIRFFFGPWPFHWHFFNRDLTLTSNSMMKWNDWGTKDRESKLLEYFCDCEISIHQWND